MEGDAQAIPKQRLCFPERLYPKAWADEPLVPGADYLRDLFFRFMDRSTQEELKDLEAWVQQERRFTCGTMCSGSDAPMLVMEAFDRACRERFKGLPRRLQGGQGGIMQVFACEKEARKAGFIAHMWPECGLIFKKCEDMASRQAPEWTTKALQPTPLAKMLLAGFQCTDNSCLNAKRSQDENRSCVANKSLNTGRTFAGILGWIETNADVLQLAIFENTPGLATPPRKSSSSTQDLPDNLSVAAHELRQLGFWMKSWELSPCLFGVPQSRKRLWMVCFQECLGEPQLEHGQSKLVA